jgi:hypothetical protein
LESTTTAEEDTTTLEASTTESWPSEATTTEYETTTSEAETTTAVETTTSEASSSYSSSTTEEPEGTSTVSGDREMQPISHAPDDDDTGLIKVKDKGPIKGYCVCCFTFKNSTKSITIFSCQNVSNCVDQWT